MNYFLCRALTELIKMDRLESVVIYVNVRDIPGPSQIDTSETL